MSHTYLIGKKSDFLIAGGLSILIIPFLFILKWHTTWIAGFPLLAHQLTLVVNYPHFSATCHRLLGSKNCRDSHPWIISLFTPLCVFGAMAALFMWQQTKFPAQWIIHLFTVWVPFHYSGQTMGITLFYARREGLEFSPMMRNLFGIFIYSLFLFSVTGGEIPGFPGNFYGIEFPHLKLPYWTYPAARNLLRGTGLLLILTLILWMIKHRRLFPLLVLTPALAHFCWYVPAFQIPGYNSIVPLFHSLQYLPFVWTAYLNENLLPERRTTRPMILHSLRWYAINVAGGAFLFIGLPWIAQKCGYPYGLSMAVVLASVQIHHFYTDGKIWKLRRPEVMHSLKGVNRLLVPKSAIAT